MPRAHQSKDKGQLHALVGGTDNLHCHVSKHRKVPSKRWREREIWWLRGVQVQLHRPVGELLVELRERNTPLKLTTECESFLLNSVFVKFSPSTVTVSFIIYIWHE